jgi:uncharacterized membrane-anchored protein
MALFKKKPQTVLILTGVSFFASGIDCFDNNLIIMGVISILVALINGIATFFVKKHPFYVKITLLSVNAVFAALSSYLYFMDGRDKIQYGWAIVSLIYLISIPVAFRKQLKHKKMIMIPTESTE